MGLGIWGCGAWDLEVWGSGDGGVGLGDGCGCVSGAWQGSAGGLGRHPLSRRLQLSPFPSPRPLRVERGRKKSELIPERRIEKKKGE